MKSTIFGAEPVGGTDTKEWYRYPLCRTQVVPIPLKVVPVPIDSKGLVPVPLLPNPSFARYALLSPVFVHLLVRDPNK